VASRPASDVEDFACGRERQLLDEEVHLWMRVGEDVILLTGACASKNSSHVLFSFNKITHLFFEIRGSA
jgi:hypothetical protein